MTKQNLLYLSPFLACIAVYICGLPIDVPEIDAAQYADISIEVLQKGNWLHITDCGRDYLDKPPLVFWTAALSYLIFGIHNFSYKLPSLLFWVLGIFSTYKISRRFYDFRTSYLAALLLASCEAGFMITHDCRTDTLLTGSVIFALWQLLSFTQEKKLLYFLGGFTGIALAMLAKGPIGLMVPVLALATHFVLKKEWQNFFRWEWLAGIIWTLLLLSPMLWGLYQQFDLHPEKIVNGESKVSGIKFFFWTQSFGRITGESQWKDDSDFFFLWHTTLWAFLPWGLLLFAALWEKIRNLWKAIWQKTQGLDKEYFSLGGFFLPLIALSFSHYKLPHYIFVTYPLAAILTANYVMNLLFVRTQTTAAERSLSEVEMPSQKPFVRTKTGAIFTYLQGATAVILGLAAIWTPILVFPHTIWLILSVLVTGFIIFLLFYTKTKPLQQLILPCLIAVIWANFEANALFYPNIMQYQSCTQAGYYVQKAKIPSDRLYIAVESACAIDVPIQQRGQQFIAGSDLVKMTEKEPIYLLTSKRVVKEMQDNPTISTEIVQTFPDYPVTQLNFLFLNAKTRKSLEDRYLLRLSKL